VGSGTHSRRRPNLRWRSSGSPELGEVGRPGLVWLGFLVEGRAREEANSFVAFRRYAGALAGRAAVQGGAGGRDSPAWPKSATRLEFPARAYLGYARSTLDVPTDAGRAWFGATVVGLGAPRRRGLCAPVRRGMDGRGTGRKGITAEKSHYLPV